MQSKIDTPWKKSAAQFPSHPDSDFLQCRLSYFQCRTRSGLIMISPEHSVGFSTSQPAIQQSYACIVSFRTRSPIQMRDIIQM
jgi:hypothetical protein